MVQGWYIDWPNNLNRCQTDNYIPFIINTAQNIPHTFGYDLLDFLLAACFLAAAFFLYRTPEPSCWLTTACSKLSSFSSSDLSSSFAPFFGRTGFSFFFGGILLPASFPSSLTPLTFRSGMSVIESLLACKTK